MTDASMFRSSAHNKRSTNPPPTYPPSSPRGRGPHRRCPRGPAFFEQIERDERERRQIRAALFGPTREDAPFEPGYLEPICDHAERVGARRHGAARPRAQTASPEQNGAVIVRPDYESARAEEDADRAARAGSNLDTWSVGEVICDHAERVGATAIVMAPHGRGRLREWFVGSACRHRLR